MDYIILCRKLSGGPVEVYDDTPVTLEQAMEQVAALRYAHPMGRHTVYAGLRDGYWYFTRSLDQVDPSLIDPPSHNWADPALAHWREEEE
jgi:hypothetical protein